MRGTVTKRGNRYYPRVYVGKDENGKWKQKWGKGYETQKEADRALRRLVDEVESSFERKIDKSTLETYLRYWLSNYCEPRLADNTVRGYRVNVEKHIVPYIGSIPINALTPRDIQRLYDRLAAKGLSSTSIRYVHNNLHKALSHAVKQEVIVRNPADLVDPPLVNRFEGSALPVDAVKRLLAASASSELYLPITLALTLGLRRGEALGLQWSDVDFSAKTITVRQAASFPNGQLVLIAPKTKKSKRTLLVPDFLLSALESALSRQKDLAVFLGPDFNPHNLVCCRPDGSPITFGALQYHYKNLLKAAGLPDVRFHDLRHTNATILLRSSVPAKIVSSMLGHSSIGITMDTYSHVMTDMQSPAVLAVNQVLGDM